MSELKACAGCSGIVYRQTDSGKIIPMDCEHAKVPSCFEQALGYADKRCLGMAANDDDEPIEKCKQCPFCTANERCASHPPESEADRDRLKAWCEALERAIKNHLEYQDSVCCACWSCKHSKYAKHNTRGCDKSDCDDKMIYWQFDEKRFEGGEGDV